MICHTGLVSISFRKKSVGEIIEASLSAGITAIEWGGDVHVPHGDTETAARTAKLCAGAGIALPEYGSYYYLNESPETFADVAASARALGTPLIRIWGGKKSSDALKTEDYAALVADARRVCDMAPERILCLECHKNSVTDEYHTALRFLEDVDRENLKMFWQPNQFRDLSYNLDALRALLPHIRGVHVFSWDREQMYPLERGGDAWRQYLPLLKQAGVRNYMLEFMHDHRIESLPETANTLKTWLEE